MSQSEKKGNSLTIQTGGKKLEPLKELAVTIPLSRAEMCNLIDVTNCHNAEETRSDGLHVMAREAYLIGIKEIRARQTAELRRA